MVIDKKNVTGEDAFAYIRKQLGVGKTLSSLMGKLPIEDGVVYSFVPDVALEERVFNFDSGGLYPFNKEVLKTPNLVTPIKNESRPLVVADILNFLGRSKSNFCLFEDPAALPSDPSIGSLGIKYVCLNDTEVYYFFNGSDIAPKKVTEAFIVSEGYIFLCALSSMNIKTQNRFNASSEIAEAILEEFVNGIAMFIVGAYDHESYLMWERS